MMTQIRNSGPREIINMPDMVGNKRPGMRRSRLIISQSLNTPEDCADVLKRYMAPRNCRLMVVRVCGNQLTHYDGDDLGPDGGHIVSSES